MSGVQFVKENHPTSLYENAKKLKIKKSFQDSLYRTCPHPPNWISIQKIVLVYCTAKWFHKKKFQLTKHVFTFYNLTKNLSFCVFKRIRLTFKGKNVLKTINYTLKVARFRILESNNYVIVWIYVVWTCFKSVMWIRKHFNAGTDSWIRISLHSPHESGFRIQRVKNHPEAFVYYKVYVAHFRFLVWF